MRVPQLPEEGLKGNGGITVYYIAPTKKELGVTAFRPGFRMLVGDAGLTSSPKTPAHKVCHRCKPAKGDNSNINCGAPDKDTLPTGFCAGGIRSIITFPTCWDGKNLDSPDHKSHMAHGGVGGFSHTTCPASHPIRMPQVCLLLCRRRE